MRIKNPTNWIKALFIRTIFSLMVVLLLYPFVHWSLFSIVIVVLIYLCLILTITTEELIITKTDLTVERKSLIVFLSSKKSIPLVDIQNIRMISDQTSNDRGRILTQNVKSVLSIELIKGEAVRIYDSIHPNGIKYVKKIIEEHISTKKNAE